MARVDTRSGDESGIGRAQGVADFLATNDIAIEPESRSDGLDEYAFILHPNDGRMEEVACVLYDRRTQHLLPVTLEEMVRRLSIVPGLEANAIRPFSGLLIKTGGDFYAEAFNPIHEVLDTLER